MASAPIIVIAHHGAIGFDVFERDMLLCCSACVTLHEFVRAMIPDTHPLAGKELTLRYQGKDVTYIRTSTLPSYYGIREGVVAKERRRQYTFWEKASQYLFSF